jgi:hypothetical protein
MILARKRQRPGSFPALTLLGLPAVPSPPQPRGAFAVLAPSCHHQPMNMPNLDLSHLSPEQLAEVRRMAEDPDVRAKAYLVGNKIPWDLATALTFDEKVSFAKAIARIEDSNFEWSTMRLTRLRGKDIP